MKTLFKNVTILIILAVVNVSCEEAKELADIKVNTTIVEYFDVDLEGGDLSKQSETFNISIATSELDSYLDKLEDLKIERITFEIVNFNGDEDAEFEFEFKGDGNLFLKEDIIISQAFSNKTIFEVSNTDELNKLAAKLLNKETVTIFIEAASNNLDSPIYYKTELKFYIAVTANPL